MTSPAVHPSVSHVPRAPLDAIDPESDAGKAISTGLAVLFDDIAERLRREGKPVPDCIA